MVHLLQGGKGTEEGGIVAVIETLGEGGEEWLGEEGLGYFGGFHYLCVPSNPTQFNKQKIK